MGKLPMDNVHVYSIIWNEAFILPYFLRHYSLYADRIFIINDHSTDKTAQIAKRNPKVTLLNFPFKGGLNEDNFNATFAKFYKKYSRGKASWVMCVDADEIIYHKDILNNLSKQRQKGVRIIKTTGYTMIGKKLPKSKGQIYEECRLGVRTREYDKPVVFDPKLNISFEHGRHNIKPIVKILPVRAKLTLFHFKYLSKAYFLKKAQGTFKRTPSQAKYKEYRIKKGLRFYDEAIKKAWKVI